MLVKHLDDNTVNLHNLTKCEYVNNQVSSLKASEVGISRCFDSGFRINLQDEAYDR